MPRAFSIGSIEEIDMSPPTYDPSAPAPFNFIQDPEVNRGNFTRYRMEDSSGTEQEEEKSEEEEQSDGETRREDGGQALSSSFQSAEGGSEGTDETLVKEEKYPSGRVLMMIKSEADLESPRKSKPGKKPLQKSKSQKVKQEFEQETARVKQEPRRTVEPPQSRVVLLESEDTREWDRSQVGSEGRR